MAEESGVTVRPMVPQDLAETLDMWVDAWQAAYPNIDFGARRGWTKDRIAELERTGSHSLIALRDNRIVGALVVNPETGYLDQLVVATADQGRGIADILLAQARCISPQKLDLHVNQDNARAIGFYRKHGFVTVAEDVNPRSRAPIYRMRWEAGRA